MKERNGLKLSEYELGYLSAVRVFLEAKQIDHARRLVRNMSPGSWQRIVEVVGEERYYAEIVCLVREAQRDHGLA